MLLDLGKIVENPGRVPFTCEPELADLRQLFDDVSLTSTGDAVTLQMTY